ncbi:MAG: hypothetical protein ThorAB25_22470 [Candidatus Thorarchaeota archaeon AB_25]|nr:MAG: hypothetical protein ThorAB25_22470 [Candidatus Thorarchaeota archaeon AB_25]
MERGGIPLFFMKIDPRAQDLDPMLVSGFFTAIQTFSKEVVDRSSSRFQVDYGARLFTVLTGKSTDLVAVSMGECEEEVVLTLTSLLEEFETVWIKDLTREEMDTLDLNTAFMEFREGILQNLSFRQILGSWIPFFVGTSVSSDKSKDSIVVPFIDGSRNVDAIITESGLNREDVTIEITRLWALGALQFRSILAVSDVVISTSKLDRLLQSSSPQRAELVRTNPDILAVLPRMSTLFDGRRTVGAITRFLSEQYSERALMQAFDFLMESKAIDVLSPEKRRILLTKEAMEIAIKVAENVYSEMKAYEYLEATLTKVAIPEVVGEVHLTNGKWEITYASRLHEGLDPRRLMELYADWVKLLAQFMGALDKTKIRAYAEELTDAYSSYLLKRYTADDLRGFEEISYWLELNCVRM